MTRSFFGADETMLNCLMSSPYLECDEAIKEDSLLTEKLTCRGESLDLDDHLALFDPLNNLSNYPRLE